MKNEKENEKFKPIFKGDLEMELDVKMLSVPISSLTQSKWKGLFPLDNPEELNILSGSIRVYGVISPIIIRKTSEKDKYEILSGHNRVEAAKMVGLETIPAIIKEVPDDNDAMLIVTESNLLQRSINELSHSQRALIIHNHYEAMKNKPDYFTTLLSELDNMKCAPMGRIGRRRDKVGILCGMSKTEIARYLRFYKLIDPLKKRLDIGNLTKRAAESLSFLDEYEQKAVESCLTQSSKINMKQADEIKKLSQEGAFSDELVKNILASPKQSNVVKRNSVVLNYEILDKYFKSAESSDEINTIISSALELYFKNENN